MQLCADKSTVFKVMLDVDEQEWKEGVNHSGVFRQEIICEFCENTSNKVLKVPFLAIWPLAGGSSGRFPSLQVKLTFKLLF